MSLSELYGARARFLQRSLVYWLPLEERLARCVLTPLLLPAWLRQQVVSLRLHSGDEPQHRGVAPVAYRFLAEGRTGARRRDNPDAAMAAARETVLVHALSVAVARGEPAPVR